jgi:hypothetical protein
MFSCGRWDGPSWLEQNEEELPKTEVQFSDEEILKEKRRGVIPSFLCTILEENCYLWCFSQYSQMLRAIRWVQCFIRNSKMKIERWERELFVADLEGIGRKLLNIAPQEVLTVDI